MSSIDSILQNHNLRKTNFRVELLGLFHKDNPSLTPEEIRNKVEASIDKVTIYRALDAFEKNGIIHKVPDKNNLTRYALCQSDCSVDEHTHNHAHFICNSCDETFCIEEVEVPKIKNANGFKISGSTLTLEGICPDCQQKAD